tara:strand:- start:4475 stop:4657 length:183 start_codon:yes stop_codon:yes gene_type:complete
MTDKNDNEMRGLPADIDVLITAAKQVVRGHNCDINIDKRIMNLEAIVNRVDDQYKEIINN